MIAEKISGSSFQFIVLTVAASSLVLAILLNILKQILFKKKDEPPVVFHWFPFVGSAVTYGQRPPSFFRECQRKYGDVFTFVMFGRKITTYLGTEGNNFILNGKQADLNPEEVYNCLTGPCWGSDVVYDAPHAKFMEQKRLIKFGLTTKALNTYVPLIVKEMSDYFRNAPVFQGTAGVVDLSTTMAEIIIFTASRCLQGKEVREKLNSTFAKNYHDLDMGFTPINFLFPGLPLPRNRKRDIAQKRMARTYVDIIQARRDNPDKERCEDMIWNLMNCTYKDGSPMPDKEIAHLMIALLMAGQASSAVTSSWMILHLAADPTVASALYDEQLRVLGSTDASLSLQDVKKLPLHANVVRETLRLHPPVHSVMRKVKRPIPINGSAMHVPPSNILMAAIGHTGRSVEYFENADIWSPRRWDSLSYLQDEKRSVKVDYGYGPVSAGGTNPYLPFGGGRHRCIGEQFTYLQLTTVLATMVRTFEFRNVGGQKGVVETDYSSMVARPKATKIQWWKRNHVAKEKS